DRTLFRGAKGDKLDRRRLARCLPMSPFRLSLGLVLSVASVALAADAPKRVPWTTSKVVGSPDPPHPYRTAKVFESLPLDHPIYAVAEPGTDNLWVIEYRPKGGQTGRIRRFVNRPDVSESEVLHDLDAITYGLAFHPKYQENGYVFVMSNGPMKGEPKQNRIARFTVDRKPPYKLDPASELTILEFASNGHNGGEPAFGPDGYLYYTSGDGTSDSDPDETGQGVNDLLSVVIRIDIDHPDGDRPYSIPPDNPFVNVPDAKPEIWAFGFRNPWRNTFDKVTGHFWVTQNGQDLWEQVYFVRRGENYGWSVQEGSHPFYLDRKVGPGPIVPPVAEHHHSEARSLTGGVVYYGKKVPELRGTYIYGDYSTGRVWGIRHDGTKVTWHRELVDTPFAIAGFAETQDGELLIVDENTGLHRVEVNPPVADPPYPFPQRLSETGLFDKVKDHDVADGVIPYSVNVALWSDGAHKERFLALPGDSQMEFTAAQGWKLPEGSVLVKTFALDLEAGNTASRKRIETRLFTKQQNEWIGYSYVWNDEQTDAVLVESRGADKEFTIRDAAAANGVRTQTWHYPSRAECLICHSRAAAFVLGLQTEQMNRLHDYGDGPVNQLERLAALGLFTKPPKPAAELPAFVDPYDVAQPLDDRVKAYLHVNCSNCHQHAGGGNSQIDLLFNAKPDKQLLIGAKPNHGTFSLTNAQIVAPGDPTRSVMLYRLSVRGRGQMPPLASSMVDAAAVDLLRQWIQQLPAEIEKVSGR
ncbi:MAG TPA: PQQ-dependent sugar dehydrogenase, partial [Planctomycetaceae bacterium]|nr:PQQ-dependent sugar dehydrogenase [Planctomycetaceae bacterium]